MKHRFIVIISGVVVRADYDAVAKILSVVERGHLKYEKYLRLFTLHNWRVGRWMVYPDGIIFCEGKEIK